MHRRWGRGSASRSITPFHCGNTDSNPVEDAGGINGFELFSSGPRNRFEIVAPLGVTTSHCRAPSVPDPGCWLQAENLPSRTSTLLKIRLSKCDALNSKFGRDKVSFGSSKRRHLGSELLSARYTMEWKELLRVRSRCTRRERAQCQ